jgi:hypothetical protein
MYEVGRQKSTSHLTKRNTESCNFFYSRDNIYDSTQCEEFPICMNKTISSQIALRSTSMEYLMGCSGCMHWGAQYVYGVKVGVVVMQRVNCYMQTSWDCFRLRTSELFCTFISFSSICRLLSKVIHFKCHCNSRVLRRKDET